MTDDAPTTPTGRAMRADARRNRERLLVAAREAFAERPHDVSMDDIAKRAGVGVGTLFRNFPRRLDLVEALYEEDLATLGTLAGELAATRPPWEALVEWMSAFVAFSQAKRGMFSEISSALERGSGLGQQTRDRIDAAIGTLLDRALAAGEVDPDLTPHDLVQLVGGMVLSIVADDDRTDYLLALLLRGIRTPGR